MHLVGRDVLDTSLGVSAVGDDACLGSGEGNRLLSLGLKGDSHQRDRLLLARGQQHVHLTLIGQRRDLLSQTDELVSDSAHGGDHDNHLVALRPILGDASSDILDTLRIADGSSAEFLHNQGHGRIKERCFWRKAGAHTKKKTHRMR